MLRWRLLGTVAILIPVLGLLYLDANWNGGHPGIWLLPLGMLLVAAGVGELHHLARRSGWTEQGPFVSILCAEIILLSAFLPSYLEDLPAFRDQAWAIAMFGVAWALMLRMLVAMSADEANRPRTIEISLSFFHAIFVALALVFLLRLRLLWDDSRGLWAMASIPWVAKWSDTGAYFIGRAFGKHPLARRLSPKKTWEGALGGLLFAVLAAAIFFLAVPRILEQPILRFERAGEIATLSLVFGATLAIFGMLGDLAESLLKRDAQQKDSGGWLPGLGGILDVMDSVLWTAPVGYFIWLVIRA